MEKPNQRQQGKAAQCEPDSIEGKRTDKVHADALCDESQPPDGGGGQEKNVCSSLHNGYIVCLRANLRKRLRCLPTGCL